MVMVVAAQWRYGDIGMPASTNDSMGPVRFSCFLSSFHSRAQAV